MAPEASELWVHLRVSLGPMGLTSQDPLGSSTWVSWGGAMVPFLLWPSVEGFCHGTGGCMGMAPHHGGQASGEGHPGLELVKEGSVRS